ncbi:hypothetical protein Ntsu_60590 [Nocardia sp. IFM 10818]
MAYTVNASTTIAAGQNTLGATAARWCAGVVPEGVLLGALNCSPLCGWGPTCGNPDSGPRP